MRKQNWFGPCTNGQCPLDIYRIYISIIPIGFVIIIFRIFIISIIITSISYPWFITHRNTVLMPSLYTMLTTKELIICIDWLPIICMKMITNRQRCHSLSLKIVWSKWIICNGRCDLKLIIVSIVNMFLMMPFLVRIECHSDSLIYSIGLHRGAHSPVLSNFLSIVLFAINVNTFYFYIFPWFYISPITTLIRSVNCTHMMNKFFYIASIASFWPFQI